MSDPNRIVSSVRKMLVESVGVFSVEMHNFTGFTGDASSSCYMLKLSKEGVCLYVDWMESLFDLTESFLGNMDRFKSITGHAHDGELDSVSMMVYDAMLQETRTCS